MIRYTTGNLLDAQADALVNTVNTVGVMGKGIALMFKEAFPDAYEEYKDVCDRGEFEPGTVLAYDRQTMIQPRWILHFATKKHWRNPSKIEWIESGLIELRQFVLANSIQSVAIPPLGAGNGKLEWAQVRPLFSEILGDLDTVDVLVYEPTDRYQNVQKAKGKIKLTPSRALMAEAIRRYALMGSPCTLLEAQKLGWFINRSLEKSGRTNPMRLSFDANRYGPYAHKLNFLLDAIDGSYISLQKRVADSKPFDPIFFQFNLEDRLSAYLNSEGKEYLEVINTLEDTIDGFESPLGLELLSTVDWLLFRDKVSPTVDAIKSALSDWRGGEGSAARKLRLFDDRMLQVAIDRLVAA